MAVKILHAFLAGASILLAISCAGGEPGSNSIVIDSAGVMIVESHVPAWDAGNRAAWLVGEEPLLEIGAGDDELSAARHDRRDTTT
jgi:hypothetical protein